MKILHNFYNFGAWRNRLRAGNFLSLYKELLQIRTIFRQIEELNALHLCQRTLFVQLDTQSNHRRKWRSANSEVNLPIDFYVGTIW